MIETKFKDTEVGRIPEDWEVVKLSEKGELLRGSLNPQLYPTKQFVEYSMPSFDNGKIPETKDGITMQSSRTCIKAPVLLYNKLNVRQRRIWFVELCAQNSICSMEFLPYVSKHIDLCCLKYFVDTDKVTSDFIGMSRGTSNSQKRIAPSDFLEYKIGLPKDIAEQSRIASALSSIDNLISALDKLIEKKKNIKQGTMQQLLTGKKRLKGFSEPWEEKTLQSLGYFDGKAVTPYLTPNDIFYEYSMLAFDEYHQPCTSKGSDMLSARVAISDEVLLINKLNVRKKRIWHIKRCEENAVCSGEFLPYKSSVIDLSLLSYILLTDKVVQDFIDMSTGTSNSQRRVRPKNILDYKVNIPMDKKEQKAIASVLSSMDNEISALESKKAKYNSMKQGMMQQLLTGKIRLI